MRRITPLLPLLVCSYLFAQQSGIEGTAIDSVTRQPLAGVHIMMRGMPEDGLPSRDTAAYGAISRQDGHFSIANVNPGIYFLMAQHNGYLHMPPKAPGGRDDDSVTLKPGDQIKDFIVQMTPHAVIVGHVLDENGDPLQHVDVRAQAAGSAAPSQMMEMNGRTDDRGQFRIVLAPGKYYLEAMLDRMGLIQGMMGGPEIRSDGQVPPVYGPTFYPGVAGKDRAIPVELAPGQSVTGIDIRLAQKRSFSISGTVTGIPASSVPGPPAFVNVASSGEGAGPFMPPAFTGPDGKFSVSGLTPGSYRLMARFQSMNGADLQSPAVDVHVESGDETGVILALAPGDSVSGTLEIEGDTAKSARAEKLTVRLETDSQRGNSDGRSKPADVGDNGAFRVEQIFPGKFRVRVAPMPENAYIKSVKLGGIEAPDGLLDLSRGVSGAGIHITLSRNGGQVEGTVVGEDGAPVRGSLALVALAATADDIDGQNFKPVRAGEKFRFTGLRPGKYRVVAIDVRQFSGDLASIRTRFPNAPEIEVHEGDRIAKDVKTLPMEDAGGKQ